MWKIPQKLQNQGEKRILINQLPDTSLVYCLVAFSLITYSCDVDFIIPFSIMWIGKIIILPTSVVNRKYW